MTEIPNGTSILPTDEAERKTREILERVESVQGYGDIVLQTRVADLPEVDYLEPMLGDPDQRPIGRLYGTSVEVGPDALGERSLILHPWNQLEPIVLPLGEVASLWIDHPFGRQMPLHKSLTPALGLSDRTGVPILRWPDHFIEYGWRMRVETEILQEHPGVGVIRTYQADSPERSDAPTLEEAKEQDGSPGLYFVSRIKSDSAPHKIAVVTSKLGYDQTTPVIVRHPRHPSDVPRIDVEMLDMAKETGEDTVLDNHLERVRRNFGDPDRKLTQMEVDEVFLYAVND